MKSTASVAPLRVLVMGVTLELDVPDEATRARLAHQWARAVVHGSVGPVAGRVTMQPGEEKDQLSRDYQMATRLTMAALVETVGARLNIHAGGLADPEGRVLAVVGPSGSGKTTATRLLAGRLAYLSDETVSVAPDGTVAPHPKPLSVVLDPAKPFLKEQLSPDDLGLITTPAAGTLARLVVLHRGAEGPSGLVQLDEVQGLLELIEQTSSLGLLPDPLRLAVRLIRACGGIWALEYDEIADHLDTLVDHLASNLPAVDDVEPVPHPGSSEGDEPADGQVARKPWIDAVELGSDLVVLIDTRAVHLAGLTATIWLELSSPRSPEDLVDAARRIHGDHPDAAAIVDAALVTLSEQDLVTWGRMR